MIVSMKGCILPKTQGLAYDRDPLADEWAIRLDRSCCLSKLTQKLVTNNNSLHLSKKLPAAVLLFIQSVSLWMWCWFQCCSHCAVLAINRRPLLLLQSDFLCAKLCALKSIGLVHLSSILCSQNWFSSGKRAASILHFSVLPGGFCHLTLPLALLSSEAVFWVWCTTLHSLGVYL